MSQDGHPVLWHIIYKEWVRTLSAFSRAIFEKPAAVEEQSPGKAETVAKPAGRALGVEAKPTTLYSTTDKPAAATLNPAPDSTFSTLVSKMASDSFLKAKQTTSDYFVASRIGKMVDIYSFH